MRQGGSQAELCSILLQVPHSMETATRNLIVTGGYIKIDITTLNALTKKRQFANLEQSVVVMSEPLMEIVV